MLARREKQQGGQAILRERSPFLILQDAYPFMSSRLSNDIDVAQLLRYGAIHKGRPADPGEGVSAEFGRSIVIRV